MTNIVIKTLSMYGFTGIFVIAIVAAALVGYSVFAFSIGTATYTADVYITLRDADGRPLENVTLDGWGGQSKDYLHTDKDGTAFMQVGYQDVATLLGAPKWPKDMAVKLRFENHNQENPLPHFQLLYYRFEIDPRKKKCAYNVFVSDYDYWFGETWVGTFHSPSTGRKPEFKKTVLEGYRPTTYTAIPPRRRDTYDDVTGNLVRGADLSEVDVFETNLDIKKTDDRKIEIHLDIEYRGSYSVAQ